MPDQSDSARVFYDRISGAYDALSDASEHTYRERGLELLAVREGETVLEIGYGTGHSLAALAQSVGASGRVVGVDVSEGMRDVALKRLAGKELADRVDLRVQPAPPLPGEDGAFDAVSLSFTFELFEPDVREALLAEIRRVLTSGGRLGVVSMAAVPSGERESVLEKTYRWMHQHFPHIVDCQPIPLEEILEKADFELVEVERKDMFTMPVAMTVATPR